MNKRLLRASAKSGLDLERTAATRYRFIEPPLFPQRLADVVVRQRVVRLESEHPAVTFECRVVLAQQVQRRAQIEMRADRVGIHLKRTAETLRGLTRLPEQQQRVAEVVMRFGKIGIELRRAVKASGRILEPAALLQCAAELEMHRCGVRIDLDDSPEARNGFVVSPERLQRICEAK